MGKEFEQKYAEILEKNSKILHELKKEILNLPGKIEECLKLEDIIKQFSKRIYQEIGRAHV